MLPKLIWSLVIAASAWTLAGCQSSPTGRSQLILVSEEKVARMGEQSFAQIKANERWSRDRDAIRIVNCVADSIIRHLDAEGRGHGWEVIVFDGNMVNAFALPGNKIGVYEGIFRAARNQDQLAAVIGHEVAHVLAKHAAERVSTGVATQTGLGIAKAAAGGAGTPGGELTGLLGAGAAVGIILPFNRKQESEADVLGLDLMASAGFDPSAAIPLWENMGRIGKEQPPEFLSTHPSGETRMKEIRERLPDSRPYYEQARAAGITPTCGF